MRTLNSTILAQLQAKELRPFLILDMDLDGTHVRYTDCDVPLGVRYKYEAITGGPTVHGLSLADGAAFVRLNGLDLSPFAGVAGVRTPCKLTLTDSAAKQSVGWIAEADAAEALGSDLQADNNGDMEGTYTAGVAPGWYAGGATLTATEETVDAHGGSGSSQKITWTSAEANAALASCDLVTLFSSFNVTAGKLYEISFWIKIISGTLQYVNLYNADTSHTYQLGSNLVANGAWTNYSYSFTAAFTEGLRLQLGGGWYSACSLIFDDFTVNEVTHVGADGVHIVSTQNGSTRNWASIEAGFNYNDTAYTAEIGNVRFTPRGMKFEPIRYSTGRVVDSMKVQIDNLDDALTVYFVGGTPQGGTVTLQAVLLDSAYEMVAAPLTLFEGTLDGWDLDEEKVSLTVASELVRWNQKTLAKHSPSCRWKEFKGTECAYAGAETWCDRTYTRCAALGNQANFGGFRWLPSIQEKEIWWGKNRAI